MPETTNRAQCPICGHSVRLTREGTLALHEIAPTMIEPVRRCAGSGRKPSTH